MIEENLKLILNLIWNLTPYLGLAIFFLGTILFNLIRGFVIILMCALIVISIVILYCYNNELKQLSKPEIIFVSYLILIPSFIFAGEIYNKNKKRL